MSSFSYKVLVVDNEDKKESFQLKTGKIIPAKTIDKIDDALVQLGIPIEYLNQDVTRYDGIPCHDYDIVLLDFEMNENKILERGKGELVYEYPMGAVSLQPLYLLGFKESGKLGSCVVQAYSKVMWGRCPKAAAVTHIVHNLISNQPLLLIHNGSCDSIDISGLIKTRAASIIAALPFSALRDLRELMSENDNIFINKNLPSIAQVMNVEQISISNLRPDSNDVVLLRTWLNDILKNRGYAYEAYMCWKNKCVNAVAHDATLRKDYEPTEPWMWPNSIDQPERAIIIQKPGGTYHVSPTLLRDLEEFDRASFFQPDKRKRILHQLFRLDLSASATGNLGYCLNDAIDELGFAAVLAGKAQDPGLYVYVHRTDLVRMLYGIKNITAGRDFNGMLVVYANNKFPYVYFIALQNIPDDIRIHDCAQNIRTGLSQPEQWNSLGENLEFWGGLEIWGEGGSWSVSKHICNGITGASSPLNDNELLSILGQYQSNSQIVLVLPRVKKEA